MILPPAIKARPLGPRKDRQQLGWTLTETMVALGVGMLVMATMAATTIICLRTFAGIYNYSDLDASSRSALNIISREVREATGVVTNQQASLSSYIQIVNTNVIPPITNTFTWDRLQQKLTWDKTGQVTIPLLTKCTNWSCTLLEGYPSNNYNFSEVALTPDACKIVDMRWSCARSIFGINVNSETEQGAQIVLRNGRAF